MAGKTSIHVAAGSRALGTTVFGVLLDGVGRRNLNGAVCQRWETLTGPPASVEGGAPLFAVSIMMRGDEPLAGPAASAGVGNPPFAASATAWGGESTVGPSVNAGNGTPHFAGS
jgi:hypothetical protein